jgi:hypothetical protein
VAESRDRDWIDISAKLMLPLVLAIIGAIYTVGKDTQAEKQRQWERDSGLMRMLASSNSDERQLGLKIIDVLQNEHEFSDDLKPLVEAIKRDSRPSDPSKKLAETILKKDGGSTSPFSSSNKDKREVYIQIGHEDQRQRASDLQATLRQAGFSVPDIDLVPHATFETFIRYFDPNGQLEAHKIDAIMKGQGFKPKIQDFTKTDSAGQTALEVWFGDREPANPIAPSAGN